MYREVLFSHHPADILHDCSVNLENRRLPLLQTTEKMLHFISCRGRPKPGDGGGWQCGSNKNNLVYSHGAFILIKALLIPSH